MAAVRSEGGRVEVDSSNTIMTKSSRKNMAAARSKAGVEAAVCSRAEDEAVVCSGARIEDGRWRRWPSTAVSRATAERERA
jgi:hypothetical protein